MQRSFSPIFSSFLSKASAFYSRLQELAAKGGRASNELLEDAMAGYLQELVSVRDMLDGRYDDIKSGRVQPVDGKRILH